MDTWQQLMEWPMSPFGSTFGRMHLGNVNTFGLKGFFKIQVTMSKCFLKSA